MPRQLIDLPLRRTSARIGSETSPPAIVEWLVVIAGLIVQQGAFVAVPLIAADESFRVTVNPYNTFAVSVSMAALAVVMLPHIRRMWFLALQNKLSMLFLALVLTSVAWSIHPDITLRRAVGYIQTMALSGYLVARFGPRDRMRALSASFAVTAIGSVLLVLIAPRLGIMHEGELSGTWRGVFPHKNVLGPVMAAAVFAELYLIATTNRRGWWRYSLLSLFAALVVLSQSVTAILLVALYAGATCIYSLWRRHRLAAIAAIVNAFFAVVGVGIAYWQHPALLLVAVGKDATLTGRTSLWAVVSEFIRLRPLLGWGYHAMWVVGDPTTTLADKLTGNWGVTSSHNGFLEIALQLGIAGLLTLFAILTQSVVRALRCCRAGHAALGWFTLIYVVGAILAAQTMETLGQNQVIEWVMFNVLVFGCAAELAVHLRAPTRTILDRRPRLREKQVGEVVSARMTATPR